MLRLDVYQVPRPSLFLQLLVELRTGRAARGPVRVRPKLKLAGLGRAENLKKKHSKQAAYFILSTTFPLSTDQTYY